jgi:hypothetical protein
VAPDPPAAVRTVLRLEAAAVAAGAGAVAWHFGPPWWLAVLVLAAPDLALASYLRGPRLGAAVYNAAHSYIGPALLTAIWFFAGNATAAAVAALWALHIAADRLLGYGLKYPTAFGETHLGRIGRS